MLNRLSARIAHRGPGAAGSVALAAVALAHRRLSAPDLSVAAQQPLELPDGSAVLAYDGKIYNDLELRRRLAGEGIAFGSSDDTEVLLHACHAWGVTEASRRLNGMFAFAYWDARNDRLWLVRDRIGIKPLYYHCNARRVTFASEVRAILEDIEPELDDSSLLTLLMGGPIPEPHTLFRGIRAVEAGSAICFAAHGRQVSHRFAALEDLIDSGLYQELDNRPDNEVVSLFQQLLTNSVQLHLADDVGIATMASGGLDSSLIASMAGAHLRELRLYHANVVGRLSELPYATALASHTSQALRVVHFTPEEFLRQLAHVTYFNECPIAQHPNTVPFALVCRLASQEGVKVLLMGDGADELFGGYSMFHTLTRRRYFGRLRDRLTAVLDRVGLSRVGRLARWLTEADSHWGFNSSAFSVVTHGRWLERVVRARDGYSFVRDPLEREYQADLFAYLHSYLQSVLWRTDRMSMAVGVKNRLPFLENEVVRHALNLPWRFKRRRGVNKWIVRQVAAQWLPTGLIGRVKRGFPVELAGSTSVAPGFFSDGFLEHRFSMGPQQREAIGKFFPDLRFPLLAVECWGRLFCMGEHRDSVAERLTQGGSL